MAAVPGRWITPPEAHAIASELRSAADQIKTVYQSVNGVGNQLDETWYGNAKNIFDSHFNSFPKELLAYASQLDQMAQEVLQIRIFVPAEG